MKTLEDLHNYLVELELEALAQELAIIRYKASMWDKYQREARIHKDLIRAIDVTHDTHELRYILEENKRELQEFGDGDVMTGTLEDRYDWVDPILHPHAGSDYPSGERAFHDFEPATKEFEQHKDASGQTYTGHDDEDLPGEARKGEN